jgi:hypothetical protein
MMLVLHSLGPRFTPNGRGSARGEPRHERLLSSGRVSQRQRRPAPSRVRIDFSRAFGIRRSRAPRERSDQRRTLERAAPLSWLTHSLPGALFPVQLFLAASRRGRGYPVKHALQRAAPAFSHRFAWPEPRAKCQKGSRAFANSAS